MAIKIHSMTAVQRRLMAGTAILGMMINGQYGLAQTPPPLDLPVCEKQETLSNNVQTFTRLIAGNNAPNTFLPSASAEDVIAWFELPPDHVSAKGLKVKADPVRLKLKRTKFDNSVTGIKGGDLAWKEWTFELPQIIDATTGAPINLVSVSISLDSGSQFIYLNALNFLNQSTTPGTASHKSGIIVTQNDSQVISNNKASAPIRPWMDSNEMSGNFMIVAVPAEDLSRPSGQQRFMRWGFNKANAVRAKSIVESDVNALILAHDSKSCKPYSSGCFLTTAACDVVGLEDDCWELQTLRKFRDSWLAHQPDGQADIERYYRLAPAIVTAINARNDAKDIWLSLYGKYIVPCALMAQVGRKTMARKRYGEMMQAMSRFVDKSDRFEGKA